MRFSLSVFFVLVVLYSNAQEKIEDLSPVTVIASLQPQPVAQTGRNISIIEGTYFASLPVHSLDELIRYIPGIEVQARGPMGSQSDIIIRGGTFQQVLIVLDGLRINDPNTGHFNSYIPIAPSEIDRVEVLKGAASAIYGSEAVGGVIHIISKSFAANKGKNKKEYSLQGIAGEYGLWSVNAGLYQQQSNTALSAGFLSNNANGQPQRGTRGFFNNNTASLSVSHSFNNRWRLSVRGSYDKRNFSAQNFYTTFKSDTAREVVETFWTALNLTRQGNKNRIVLDAGYKNVLDRFTFNNSGATNKNESSLWQFSGRIEQKLSTKNSLIAGVQFQQRAISSNDRGDHSLNQLAGFVLYNHQLGKYFHLMPAIRVDYTQNSNTSFIPQINLSYRKGKWQFRGSAGNTIRQADFTERFNNYNKTVVSSGSIGNPDLEAERSFSYEIGADYFIEKNISVSGGFFARDQSRLIDWVVTPYSQMPRKQNLLPTGNYALAKNIASVLTEGFEVDFRYQKTFKKERRLFLTAGIVWLNSKSSDSVISFYISSHAKFLGNFSISYRTRHFAASLNGVYKSRKSAAAPGINAEVSREYVVVNARTEWIIPKLKSSLFAEANNVFDKQYSDLLGAPMPGRWLMGGWRINL